MSEDRPPIGAGRPVLGDPSRAAERCARESFGRLVASLSRQFRDIAAAEDALADAFLKALERWPRDGVPDAPEGWLVTVARRRLLERARHDRVRFDPRIVDALQRAAEPRAARDLPDDRLHLMFVCAHPAIDPRLHAALMLQTVLGLNAEVIASAMLVSPAALAQRLVRAKRKIRDSGVRFELPEPETHAERLHGVLDAIYGAFGLANDVVGGQGAVADLEDEAIYLAQLVCQRLPDAPEALGLLALMTFSRARQGARRDAHGGFVPLAEQDVTRWDQAAIGAADRLLFRAARAHAPGPFQLEAAVQSAHCHRMRFGTTPWAAIADLYGQINRLDPTVGSLVAGAVALANAGHVEAGLRQLHESIDPALARTYQPWWVALANLERLRGATTAAAAAFDTAIGLTADPAIRRYLARCRARLG